MAWRRPISCRRGDWFVRSGRFAVEKGQTAVGEGVGVGEGRAEVAVGA